MAWKRHLKAISLTKPRNAARGVTPRTRGWRTSGRTMAKHGFQTNAPSINPFCRYQDGCGKPGSWLTHYFSLVRKQSLKKGAERPLFHTLHTGYYPSKIPPYSTKNGANTRLRMAESLIRIFSDGPEVSFKGSPTVSPTTAAWWLSDPLPP